MLLAPIYQINASRRFNCLNKIFCSYIIFNRNKKVFFKCNISVKARDKNLIWLYFFVARLACHWLCLVAGRLFSAPIWDFRRNMTLFRHNNCVILIN